MKHFSFGVLCLVTCLLSGCFIVPSLKDPFGAYEAKVTINDRNAQARETIARYDRDARLVEAEQAAAEGGYGPCLGGDGAKRGALAGRRGDCGRG